MNVHAGVTSASLHVLQLTRKHLPQASIFVRRSTRAKQTMAWQVMSAPASRLLAGWGLSKSPDGFHQWRNADTSIDCKANQCILFTVECRRLGSHLLRVCVDLLAGPGCTLDNWLGVG